MKSRRVWYRLFSLPAALIGFLSVREVLAGEAAAAAIGSSVWTFGFAALATLALLVLILLSVYLFRERGGPAEVPSPREIVEEAAPPAEAEGAGTLVAGIPVNPEITRRSFITLLGWAWVAFTAATVGALSTVLRFFFPNVTYEPPSKFKVGFPNTFDMGVDERAKDAHRVWIVRDQEGFYALSTICTHLGCTPNWLSGEQKFKCPCHGSGFYATGINFEGPAPRPLPRFKIVLADDGQIEVDESVEYAFEKGEWKLPGSFLEYIA